MLKQNRSNLSSNPSQASKAPNRFKSPQRTIKIKELFKRNDDSYRGRYFGNSYAPIWLPDSYRIVNSFNQISQRHDLKPPDVRKFIQEKKF